MSSGLLKVLFGVTVGLVVAPGHALAAGVGWFQWGTEGSYVHQMAHLLFFGSMLFFIYEMRRGGLQKEPGFRYLIWACGIFAVWNLDAVFGHALAWSLLNPVILGSGLNRWLLMEDLHTWLYYLTKLTHFILLVPAVYLFYRGLKVLALASKPGEP